MRGLAAARTLRARWPTVGVIFMAALWPARLCRNAPSARDRFLTKPMRMTNLVQAVRELFRVYPRHHPSES
jgi:DNA-binding response OmpR family regulator